MQNIRDYYFNKNTQAIAHNRPMKLLLWHDYDNTGLGT